MDHYSFGANGDSVSGANGDIQWRHLIHSMAILSSQSPFRVSGSFGDPMAPIDLLAPLTTMATMAIHLRHSTMAPMATMVSMATIAQIPSDYGDPLVPMAATMAPMTSIATMVPKFMGDHFVKEWKLERGRDMKISGFVDLSKVDALVNVKICNLV